MCYTQTRQQISENEISGLENAPMLELWTGLYSNMFKQARKGNAQSTTCTYVLSLNTTNTAQLKKKRLVHKGFDVFLTKRKCVEQLNSKNLCHNIV